MKTTAGKTKTPKRGRMVRIDNGRRNLTTIEAVSLKAALQTYWHSTLSTYDGWRDPVYVGNTLTCTDKMGETRVYTAHEVS